MRIVAGTREFRVPARIAATAPGRLATKFTTTASARPMAPMTGGPPSTAEQPPLRHEDVGRVDRPEDEREGAGDVERRRHARAGRPGMRSRPARRSPDRARSRVHRPVRRGREGRRRPRRRRAPPAADRRRERRRDAGGEGDTTAASDGEGDDGEDLVPDAGSPSLARARPRKEAEQAARRRAEGHEVAEARVASRKIVPRPR